MIGRGMLRGGLAGAIVAIAFSILSVIPVCGFAALPLRLLAWVLAGYIGGRIAIQSGALNGGVAAGAGAGVIAGLLDGLANIALAPLRFSIAGGTITSLHLLPQGVLDVFAGWGIDLLAMNTVGGSIFFASLLCSMTWFISGIVGSLGGGIAQALRD